VRSLAGVESASVAALVPFGEFTDTERVLRPGQKPAGDGRGEGISANYNIVGAGYFTTLALPILRGRDFTPEEERSSAGIRTAIIDSPLASRLFANEDPIGQTIEIPGRDDGSTPARRLQVVGVVPGMRHRLFDRAPEPHVYVPFGQQYRANMNLHVRVGAGGTDAMLATLRRELRALDARLPVISLKTMTMHRDASLELWMVRLGGTLFAVFGAIALVLASVGVYGVRAYLVARRTREIGIRMALGAAPRDVLRMMLREGAAVTVTGLCIGVLIAAGIGRLLSRMLFEVKALDPVVFAGAFGVLATAAFLATYVPARRATRVVPIIALRSE
jgi:putative ABC transport system permease protein